MADSLLFDGQPFDRRRAYDAGIHQDGLRRMLGLGLVRHVVYGVYLDARVPDDLASRARCLRLRLPAGAAVCRLTAAWLYGVDGRSPDQLLGPPVVECVVPVGREPVARPGVRGYVAPLGAGDVEIVDGVVCTTPLRTAVDVLRWLRPHMALAVTDALAARGLVAVDALLVAIEAAAGRRGVRQARYLAAVVEPLTESFGESWLRLRLVDAGLPRPQAQIQVPDASPGGYRLDLGWPDRRVAVEYDGEEFHSSGQRRLRDERRRDDLLRRYGWTVLGVGKGEVLGRSAALEQTVAGLLGVPLTSSVRRW